VWQGTNLAELEVSFSSWWWDKLARGKVFPSL
jgi:hypothetical protein